ncbi:hypothetical protein RB25_20555 [Herbaspirillum rubrisubalbicans]|nr:hypothetical protein RB25_20555 [Herbaspirillum rubrisubalbicans]
MSSHSKNIAARYFRIVTSVADMAESGELVSDLSHSAVRACVSAMRADGAEAIDVYHFFGDALKEKYQEISPHQEKYRAVLESAYTYMAFLLLREDVDSTLFLRPGVMSTGGSHTSLSLGQ